MPGAFKTSRHVPVVVPFMLGGRRRKVSASFVVHRCKMHWTYLSRLCLQARAPSEDTVPALEGLATTQHMPVESGNPGFEVRPDSSGIRADRVVR